MGDYVTKKYLDEAGVNIIKNYIDNKDNLKLDKTTYDEDVNKAETGLKAKVAQNATDITANSTAIVTEKERAEGVEGELRTAVEKAQSDAETAISTANAKVASVSAGDESVTVDNSTATAPKVAVQISTDGGNNLTLKDNGLYVNVPAAAEYTIAKAENSGDFAAVYQLKKDGQPTGDNINIPKDLVVKEGSVVENPEGKEAGTYIKLVLQNDENNPLYINVSDLIELYTDKDTNEIDVTVDNINMEISAEIKANSIAKGKLDTGVQASLGKADTAVQTIAEGTTDGAILVGENTVVKVHGLKSAAYAETTAFDVAGEAAAVYAAIQPISTEELNGIFTTN